MTYKKDSISVLEQQFHQLDVAQSLMLRKTASIREDSLMRTATYLIDTEICRVHLSDT